MIVGYVYVSDREPGPLAAAAPGERVATGQLGPPWIVVDHSLERVIVAHWPGRLFLVGVAPAETEQEQAARDAAAAGLRPGAGYTRTNAVDIIEELPRASLFGPHGEAVVTVLEAASALTRAGAERLVAAVHPAADEAYSVAWERWLTRQPGSEPYLGGDNSCTLAVPGVGPLGSPIGKGFLVVSSAVRESAQRSDGASALALDEEGDEVLLPPWTGAIRALIQAAMALGAPYLLTAAEASVLTAAWDAVGARRTPGG